MHNQLFRKFARSRHALALPVTFLILLVSTLAIISVTYYFSVQNLETQSAGLKVSTAQQNFQTLNNVILSTIGQPGSSGTVDLSDSGGSTNFQPTGNILTISINDSLGIAQTIFNSSVGQIVYDLPVSGSIITGLYLKGDSQTITNQSGASPSQLCIVNGGQGPEIQLQYRPTVTYAYAGLQNGQPVTDIRIYIVNLNSSNPIKLQGDLPMQISCVSTKLTIQTYDVSYQPQNLAITSQLNNDTGTVSVPISSTPEGTIIYIETVISNVSIERWIQ